MSFIRQSIRLIGIGIIAVGVYQNYDVLIPRGTSLINHYLPCTLPITYSLGEFDNRFGISREGFLEELQKAESVWEKAAGKKLFAYKQSGGAVTINLIYDSRQETTQTLKIIDHVINDKQAKYNSLADTYSSLQDEYLSAKKIYDTDLGRVDRLQEEYESQVSYWNTRGGAPEREYNKLKQQEKNINTSIARLEAKRKQLNQIVITLNQTAQETNALITELKLNIDTFNTLRTTHGEEFSEGEYIREGYKEAINIYEFEDEKKLSRVLTHEFGHALGLDHVDDAEAIMYRLNQGDGTELTKSDIQELEAACKGLAQ